jgi:fatty acid desaturase
MPATNYIFEKKQLIRLFGNKSNFKGLRALIMNWICMVVCIWLIDKLTLHPAINIILYLPLSFLTSCCLRGFDNLSDQASHKNIFKTTSLHTLLEFSYAFIVFKTVNHKNITHTKNHNYYSTHKNEDPQTSQPIHWGARGSNLLMLMSVIRLLSLFYTVDYIRYQFIPHFKSSQAKIQRLLFWAIILTLILITNTWWLFLLGYIIPVFFWLPYIRFVIENKQHNDVSWLHQLLLHPHNDGFHQLELIPSTIPFYNVKEAYLFVAREKKV